MRIRPVNVRVKTLSRLSIQTATSRCPPGRRREQQQDKVCAVDQTGLAQNGRDIDVEDIVREHEDEGRGEDRPRLRNISPFRSGVLEAEVSLRK